MNYQHLNEATKTLIQDALKSRGARALVRMHYNDETSTKAIANYLRVHTLNKLAACENSALAVNVHELFLRQVSWTQAVEAIIDELTIGKYANVK